jgi:CheY-like chemotaxis protein
MEPLSESDTSREAMMSQRQPPSPILLIEDDRAAREMLIFLLQGAIYQVVSATDGLEALQILRCDPAPCLILLDLRTPRMDGWAFPRQQLQDPTLASIPAAVLSGQTLTVKVGLQLDAGGYFGKLVAPEALLETVAHYCGEGDPASGLA